MTRVTLDEIQGMIENCVDIGMIMERIDLMMIEAFGAGFDQAMTQANDEAQDLREWSGHDIRSDV